MISFLSLAAAQSCDNVKKSDYEDVSGSKAIEYKTIMGFYKGRKSWYWDFGPRSESKMNGTEVALQPIWLFNYANGTKAGNNMIDILPCEAHYSDFWEVNMVKVPDSTPYSYYKSAADVNKDVASKKITITKPGKLVNCPVVPFNSTVIDDSPNPTNGNTKPADVFGWYKGKQIFYYNFGEIPSVKTQPIWNFKTADGTMGGHNVIDVIPGDEAYTPFWQKTIVTVPDNLKGMDAIKSADGVSMSGYKVDMYSDVVNCPLTYTEEESASATSFSDNLSVGFVIYTFTTASFF